MALSIVTCVLREGGGETDGHTEKMEQREMGSQPGTPGWGAQELEEAGRVIRRTLEGARLWLPP